MLGEEGETTGTTTGDVAKIPIGTKKMFKRKKKKDADEIGENDEAQDEFDKKKKKSRGVVSD